MAGGDGAKGFVTWQTIAVAALGLLSSGMVLFGKNTIDHLDGLDKALNAQAAAFNRMAGSIDNITQSNGQVQMTLGKLDDRIHLIEEAQATTLAKVVTNEHDVAQLREDFNRYQAMDRDGFKSLGVERHQ